MCRHQMPNLFYFADDTTVLFSTGHTSLRYYGGRDRGLSNLSLAKCEQIIPEYF